MVKCYIFDIHITLICNFDIQLNIEVYNLNYLEITWCSRGGNNKMHL